jgi:hypothetical protein
MKKLTDGRRMPSDGNTSHGPLGQVSKKINGAKFGIDGPWVCPFQNCVRQPHPPFKMAAVF